MGKTKIVLVGAGSTSFGVNTLADLFAQSRHFAGSTIALCDLNVEKLARIARLAERLNAATDAQYKIEQTMDYRTVLPGAEFVFISVEVDRLERWQLDWQIPLQHGVKHVLGENGGPGGLAHALRTIELVLGIARDVEALAPDAYLINFTNPLTRVCLALERYTRLKVIGMCHQINKGYSIVGQVLGLTPRTDAHFPAPTIANQLKAQLDLKTAGLNHVTWIVDIRDRATGRDLYPEFLARLDTFDPGFEPLSRRLCRAFGLFPTTGDDHVGEYFSYAYETSELIGYDFEGRARESVALDQRVERASQPDASLDDFIHLESGERGVNVAAAILNNLNEYELTVNIENNGALPGLPDWAIVEVPALVSGNGVMPLRMDALPPAITALLNQQVAIQDRVVEAAVHGDRQAALQALLLDPLISSYLVAEALLDEFLRVHADYLPMFARQQG